LIYELLVVVCVVVVCVVGQGVGGGAGGGGGPWVAVFFGFGFGFEIYLGRAGGIRLPLKKLCIESSENEEFLSVQHYLSGVCARTQNISKAQVHEIHFFFIYSFFIHTIL
jgi:hypothetical protein